jgi:hypothetical protein
MGNSNRGRSWRRVDCHSILPALWDAVATSGSHETQATQGAAENGHSAASSTFAASLKGSPYRNGRRWRQLNAVSPLS